MHVSTTESLAYNHSLSSGYRPLFEAHTVGDKSCSTREPYRQMMLTVARIGEFFTTRHVTSGINVHICGC